MENIWFKGQRVLRTIAQVAVSGVALIATLALIAPEILDALAGVLPGPVTAWLAGAVATLAAIAAALTRIMAIPTINRWLQKLGLGTAPAGAVVVHRGGYDGPEGMTRKQYQEYLREQD